MHSFDMNRWERRKENHEALKAAWDNRPPLPPPVQSPAMPSQSTGGGIQTADAAATLAMFSRGAGGGSSSGAPGSQ